MLFKNKSTNLVLYSLPSSQFYELPMKYFKELIKHAEDDHVVSYAEIGEMVVICSYTNNLSQQEIEYLNNTLETDTDWDSIT